VSWTWYAVPLSLRDNKSLSPAEKLTLGTLLSFRNVKTNDAFPSLDTLEETTGYSRPLLCRTIKSLEKKGIIKTIKTPGRVSVYELIDPAMLEDLKTVSRPEKCEERSENPVTSARKHSSARQPPIEITEEIESMFPKFKKDVLLSFLKAVGESTGYKEEKLLQAALSEYKYGLEQEQRRKRTKVPIADLCGFLMTDIRRGNLTEERIKRLFSEPPEESEGF